VTCQRAAANVPHCCSAEAARSILWLADVLLLGGGWEWRVVDARPMGLGSASTILVTKTADRE
jgi:hypothetical protein